MTTPPPSLPLGSVPRTRHVILAGFLGLAVIVVTLIGIDSSFFDLDRHAIPKETVVHLTALLAAWFVLRTDRSTWDRVDRLLATIMVLTVIGVLGSTNRWIALRAASLSVSGITLFWAARLISGGARRLLLALIASAVAVGGLSALAQAYGIEWGVLADSRAPGGTFGNRNFMAHVMALGLPLLLVGSAVARHRLARIGAALAVVVVAAALLLSRSRAAWLAVGAGTGSLLVFTWWWLSPRPLEGSPAILRWQPPMVALTIGIIGALLVPNSLSWRSDSPYLDSLRSIVSYEEGSGRGRLIQYRTSLRLLPTAPVLGVGPGNWFVHYPQVTFPGDPSFAAADPIPTNPWPSSDWIALLVERGTLTVLLLLGVLGLYAHALFQHRRRHPLRSAVGGAVAISALTVSLFDAFLLTPVPAIMLPLLAGVLASDRPTNLSMEVGSPHPPRRRWRLAHALLIVVILSGAVRSTLTWVAVQRMGPGRNPTRALAALRVDPWNYRLLLFVAQRSRCQSNAHIRRRLYRLLPYHPAVHALSERCGDGSINHYT